MTNVILQTPCLDEQKKIGTFLRTFDNTIAIAERKGWAQEAYAYNSLVIAWPDVQAKAAEVKAQRSNTKQMTLFDND